MIESSSRELRTLRAWACGQLGVAVDASHESVRAAFLARIAAAEFAPDVESRAAWNVLATDGVLDLAVSQPAADGLSRSLRQDVEAFAAMFFRLAPPERQRQWQALHDECGAYPVLAARLAGLRPGMKVGVEALPSQPDVRQLADEILAWFVLDPAQRAFRRHLESATRLEEATRWRAAARTLQKEHAQIAQLDPAFVKGLVSLGTRPYRLRRWFHRFNRPVNRAMTTSVVRQEAVTVARRESTRWSTIAAAVVMISVLSAVGRFAALSPNGNRRPAAYPVPPSSPAPHTLPRFAPVPLPVSPLSPPPPLSRPGSGIGKGQLSGARNRLVPEPNMQDVQEQMRQGRTAAEAMQRLTYEQLFNAPTWPSSSPKKE